MLQQLKQQNTITINIIGLGMVVYLSQNKMI
jgi:hypothetical protein